ncbi:dTMP kinase [Candidatus Bipolaricaulota bacterium]|nr:dTMP kinase [Candidatus Bipolaricaulota bacterium]
MRRTTYPKSQRGVLIALEGMDASGKTTQLGVQVARLRETLSEKRVVPAADPAGTPWGAWLRANVFNERRFSLSELAEFLAFESSRACLYSDVVLPALEDSAIVICDRSPLSSLVYQGHVLGLEIPLISKLNHVTTSGRDVDLTIILDLPPEVALSRIHVGSGKRSRRTCEFLDAVRSAYLAFAKRDEAIRVVDASLGVEDVSERIASLIPEFLSREGIHDSIA